ncbi:MAG: heterodisulfide reductase-related iron-sulfur binding cluster [Dehalococcoidia bacterium]
MFDETRCDRCGDCFVRCLYVNYDKQRAADEIEELIAGREAPILSACITCFACNEYCPTDARPLDLILERQEQFDSLKVPPELIASQEAVFAVATDVAVPETEGQLLSACVFGGTDPDLYEGRLFEGLPTVKGRHFFCYILFDHLGAPSITERHAQTFVDNLAASGAEEVILSHDDCYAMLVDRVPQLGIAVPFRPVHILEYLRDYLDAHSAEITPLHLHVAYQRPCASRLSPAKEGAVDAILERIGVKRVERQYDRENALCCSGALTILKPEAAPALRARNLDDAQAAGAEAMCYLCPMCRRTMAQDVQARGLGNYHIIELVRMALGELPAPK